MILGFGSVRGQIFTSDKSSGLMLLNNNGSKAVVVMAGESGSGFYDQNGNIRQTSTSDLNGSSWATFHPGSELPQFEVMDNGQGTLLTFRDLGNAGFALLAPGLRLYFFMHAWLDASQPFTLHLPKWPAIF
jgi:hypothetical protein